ncbi:hypothetical protein [Nostoc sp. FACHB-888]|uniref:hypothetical protein n=1 Tax=Nostoc sp. FACHB-888 TaxID=2692842 RepID=UPI001687B8B4|nr:hypothetical protein [Nostoc sp. FACHB-888]MBD2249533.1 hypothetical protein [Nostoc sp. FACHB-888]
MNEQKTFARGFVKKAITIGRSWEFWVFCLFYRRSSIGVGGWRGRRQALLKPSPKDTKTASGDRRCNDRNSSTSPQFRLPAVATWSGEGLLGSRGISGGALWQARAFMFSVGSEWR